MTQKNLLSRKKKLYKKFTVYRDTEREKKLKFKNALNILQIRESP